MEFIGSLISIFFVIMVVRFIFGILGAGVNAITGGGSSSMANNPFLSQSIFNNGELTIKFKGNPNGTGLLSYVITLTEKDSGFPIQTFNPVFTNGSDSVFQIIIPMDSHFDNQFWPDWCTGLNKLPLNEKTIRCPRQGENTIIARVNIITTNGQKICAEHETTFNYNQVDRGLLDKFEDMPKIRKQIICFGMAMAYIDGSAAESEANIIKDWAKSKVETETDTAKKKELKESLNNELKKAIELGKKGKLDLAILVKNFNEIADLGDKWELMELLRDIMAADGEADVNELQMLRDLQLQLGIDPEDFNNMMNEAMSKISSVGTAATEEGDKCSTIENLIGIDPSWSNEQKKKHLAKQNNMFNNMANIADTDEARKNANKMLENIAYYRKNCLK